MAEVHGHNKILKNTIFLYSRMLLTMLIGLYTSRVILINLGIIDYGIYNIVSGFITVFGMLNLGMTSERFISYALGQSEHSMVGRIVATFNSLNVVAGIILIVLAQSVGLWFFEHKLVIPENRFDAAFWAYQLCVISFVFYLYSATYVSLIISHEEMGAFAYISVFEVLVKLIIAFFIGISKGDKLIFYSIALCIGQIISQSFYLLYSFKKFNINPLKLAFDKKIFREVAEFSSWLVLTGITIIMATQGLNILLNIFAGPAANAARGIALQVQVILYTFGRNVLQASNPQIVKAYAARRFVSVRKLLILSSKVSYFLLFSMSVPMFIYTEDILNLWLHNPPVMSVVFVKIILIWNLFSLLSNACMVTIQASGDIKRYQIYEMMCFVLIFGFSFLLLKFSFPPYSVFAVSAFMEFILLLIRVKIAFSKVHFPFFKYLKTILSPLFLSSLPVIGLAFLAIVYLPFSITNVALVSILNFLTCCMFFFKLGLSVSERHLVVEKFKRIVLKKLLV